MNIQLNRIQHKKLFIALIIAAALIMIYGVVMQIRLGFDSGVLIVYLLAAIAAICGVFIDFILKHRWIVALLCGLATLFLCVTSVSLIYSANCSVTYDEDVLIILGSGINGDVVPEQLAARPDAGIGYYSRNPGVTIVVSGGKGDGENVTEAEAMKKYLVSKGVPESSIIKEDRSVSTYTNLYNTKQILDERFGTGYTAAVITNRYHIFRAGETAKYLGMDFNCLCADTPVCEIPLRYLREFFANCRYFISILLGTF